MSIGEYKFYCLCITGEAWQDQTDGSVHRKDGRSWHAAYTAFQRRGA